MPNRPWLGPCNTIYFISEAFSYPEFLYQKERDVLISSQNRAKGLTEG